MSDARIRRIPKHRAGDAPFEQAEALDDVVSNPVIPLRARRDREIYHNTLPTIAQREESS